jgi:predicted small lipoprotein YifL
MRYARAFVLFSVTGIICGCGQKGPLVHPDAHKKKPVPAHAPAAPAPAQTPAGSNSATPPADSSSDKDDASNAAPRP